MTEHTDTARQASPLRAVASHSTPGASPLPDETVCKGTRDWPHAPPHRLQFPGTYFVTSRTLNREHHFNTDERKDILQTQLLALAEAYGWKLEAWAVLSNHFHLVAHSPQPVTPKNDLKRYMAHLHGNVTREINRLDGVQGRKLWHNFRDTSLLHQTSYLARLSYTHNNAVHHGLVKHASDYPWCSAAPFEAAVTPAWVKTIYSFKYDQIALDDED